MIKAARRLPLTAPLRLLIFRRGFGSANEAIQDTFRASDLQITTVSPYKKRPKPKEDQPLGFGNHFSDHMLEVDWDIDNGWHKPCIKPYENLSLDPAAKAYNGDDGRIRLFRPQLNMERMRRSAHRAALPDFDGSELIECMKKLIAIDRDWVPKMKGASLYVRPTLIGTEPSLGVSYSNKAKLFVITGPAIKLLADAKYVRAAKGGVGAYKMGCNYAPTLEIAREAEGMGCNQVLWLSGPEHFESFCQVSLDGQC
ncbi:unnamed protein product [Nippostrongylus brasiliensis]|uniref:branched-chain-amino-acid transaminase n=1 Tax=Nippostrongylus brasiliensis TaxID=27835 RepID=A0A0N4XHA8_NIPBR|nr:unnamed protein product [Nippostrongylus brasiliensis]